MARLDVIAASNTDLVEVVEKYASAMFNGESITVSPSGRQWCIVGERNATDSLSIERIDYGEMGWEDSDLQKLDFNGTSNFAYVVRFSDQDSLEDMISKLSKYARISLDDDNGSILTSETFLKMDRADRKSFLTLKHGV